jgi:CheY-like chemotaxis protein
VGTFDGVLTDITESAATLQGRGLAGVTLGNNLALMGVQGVTLDLALNFQTIEASNDASFLSLGHTEYVDEAVKVGGSLLSCFSTTDSRQRIQALFDGALASSSGRANIEWEGYGATIHVFPSTATPEGYLLYVTPLAEKQALEREVSALRDRIEALEKCGDAVPDLLNISQEIVGYAALIQKHAAESPLLRHITDSLSSAVRALSAKAREVVEPFRKEPESAQGPRPLIRSRKATVDPVVVFSADTKSVRHMQAALLSDSGISSVGAPLGQDALKATLTDAPSTKVLIVDVPGKAYPVTGTIRALRKLFPDLYIVCLVPGSPNSYPELQRAGAILVLPKPITPHELVRVIRGLLHLSAAMSQSDEMEVTTPRAAQRAEVANEDS